MGAFKKSRIGILSLFMVMFCATASAQTADVYEDADDIYITGTELKVAVPQGHSIFPAGDVDWFVFHTVPNHEYRIETYATTDPGADTVIKLYSSDGTTELASDDDSGIPYFFRIDYTSPGSNTYYVKVEARLPVQVNEYGIRLTDLTLTGGSGGGDEEAVGAEGGTPVVETDSRGWPIVAFHDFDDNGVGQIFVRRWEGLVGGVAGLGQWTALVGNWASIAGENGVASQVSSAQGGADFHDMAVRGSDVYIVWANKATADTDTSRIYLNHWDGTSWSEMGGSMTGYGVSLDPFGEIIDKDGQSPQVVCGADGRPVVAYVHPKIIGNDPYEYRQYVVVRKYDPVSDTWMGMDGTTNGILSSSVLATGLSMDLDSSGNPVLAWGEPTLNKIRVRKWDGAKWVSIGSDIGRAPYAEKPVVAVAPDNSVSVAWIQYHTTSDIQWLMTYDVIQVNVVRSIASGGWVGLGTSYSPLGISSAPSGGAARPMGLTMDIDPGTGQPVVGWLAGETDNAVIVKTFNGTSWVGIDGSADATGVAALGGTFNKPNLIVDQWGREAVAFVNKDVNGIVALHTYKIVGEEPPLFEGVASVADLGLGQLEIRWEDAVSPDPDAPPYTDVTYYIYRSDNYSWNFADDQIFTAQDVFDNGTLMAAVNVPNDSTSNVWSTVIAAADYNKVWGWGVRAQAGIFREANEKVLVGGVTIAVPQVVLPITDSDGDGLDDTNPVDTDINDGDVNNNGVSDGDELQAGWPDATTPRDMFDYLSTNNFEAGEAGWTHNSVQDLWHLSTAEPDTNYPGTVKKMHQHTANTSFRCALDPTATNRLATYNIGGVFIKSELVSPPIPVPLATNAGNLIVSWNEWYETETEWDVCFVSVSVDGSSYKLVRTGESGSSQEWKHEEHDITDWWLNNGQPTNMILKFTFQTLNNINADFAGWYVDDLNVYVSSEVSGNVRNAQGQPLEGAQVFVIGAGLVTNKVNGIDTVSPGKVFGTAAADGSGNYKITGLPRGIYYIKALDFGYKAEFWNGQLHTDRFYWNSFGGVINPGVYDIRQVNTANLADFRASAASLTCNFELDRGQSFSILEIATEDGSSHDVYVNQTENPEQIWNGDNNPATATNANYQTAAEVGGFAYPGVSWYTNAVQPYELKSLANGQHYIYLHPGWSGAPWYPSIEPLTREGEKTTVILPASVQSGTTINVLAASSGLGVYVNGRSSGQQTAGTTEVPFTNLGVGYHFITLRSTATDYTIGYKRVTASTSGVVNIYFSDDEISNSSTSLRVDAVDRFGNEIENATIYCNGLDTGRTTPYVFNNLKVGKHHIFVRKDGYRAMTPKPVGLAVGIPIFLTAILSDSDLDYDGVGDSFEVEAYTNVFTYDGTSQVDSDGLSNALEYAQYELHGIRMNLNDEDTDGDGVNDNIELGYDGNTNALAVGQVAEASAVRATKAKIYFQGSFLAGEKYFNDAGQVSIEGDSFRVLGTTLAADSLTVPQLVFQVNAFGSNSNILNASHQPTELVFADMLPDNVDTDGDGMWDGFEYKYRHVEGIDPLDNRGGDLDPDADGLTNLEEFLGRDGLPSGDPNTWLDPSTSDTDGDGIPDAWEIDNGLDPLSDTDAAYDYDGDGLNNLEEWYYNTKPRVADSDNDGLIDGAEVYVYNTEPLIADTDRDGLLDGQEVWDTDLDPSNGVDGGFFPTWTPLSDMDLDGLIDGPTDWDTDGDGMPDGFEVLLETLDENGMREIRPEDQRLDPSDPLDGSGDEDSDGLSNLEEYLVRDNLVGLNTDDYNYTTENRTGLYVIESNSHFVIEAEMVEPNILIPAVFSWPYPRWMKEATYIGTNGHRYLISQFADDYATMAASVVGYGAPSLYFAQIDSSNENAYVRGLVDLHHHSDELDSTWFDIGDYVWLGGLYDNVSDWDWPDATTFWSGGAGTLLYNNWETSQPSDINNTALAMRVDDGLGGWYDDSIFNSLHAVFEMDDPNADTGAPGLDYLELWATFVDPINYYTDNWSAQFPDFRGDGAMFWPSFTNDTGLLPSDNYTWTDPITGDTFSYNGALTYYIYVTNALPSAYTLRLRHRHAAGADDVNNQVWVRVDEHEWRRTTSFGSSGNAWTMNTVQELENGAPVLSEYMLTPGYHMIEIAPISSDYTLDQIHLYRESGPVALDAGINASPTASGTFPVPVLNSTGIVLWDFSTDPFNPDTDGDEMPDGWEVWNALHPVDPIPGDFDTGIIVRENAYWRYGDPDGDGVENIAEYKSRFLYNASADPYAILGSTDPWDMDSDKDGLYDGEEIKSHRSNPLDQDTDGDGLLDGIDPVGTVAGEVNSSTDIAAGGHSDRAMNDMWVAAMSPALQIYWVMVNEDGPPVPKQIFSPNINGVIAVDVTNVTSLIGSQTNIGGWNLITNPGAMLPATSPAGYSYDFFVGDIVNDPRLNQGQLTYVVEIPTDGLYNFSIFNASTVATGHYEPLPEDPDAWYSYDSVFVSIDAGTWTPIYNEDTLTYDWNWSTVEDNGADYSVFLSAGIHFITFAGRGYGYAMTRFHIYHVSNTSPDRTDISIAQSPFTVSTIHFDRPTRMWGSAMSTYSYVVKDDGLGTYVGTPVSGRGKTGQLLLQSRASLIYGGRNGNNIYDSVWRFKGDRLWINEAAGGIYNNYYYYTTDAGPDGGLAVVNQYAAGNTSSTTVVRPRPGSPVGYNYYDGDKGSDPIPIWGEGGRNNAGEAMNWAGWYDVNTDRYAYYPSGNSHDEIEKWMRPASSGSLSDPLFDDDFRGAEYTWDASGSAHQFMTNGVLNASDSGVHAGVVLEAHENGDGMFTNTVACVNIEDVLNTKDSAKPGGLRAVLKMVVATGSSITADMTVDIFGEVSRLDVGTVPNPVPHDTLTSDQNYGVNATITPAIFTPWDRYSQRTNGIDSATAFEYHTTATGTTFNVSATGPGKTVAVDVTDIVNDIFHYVNGAGDDKARWELGNSIGFVMKVVSPTTAIDQKVVFSSVYLTIVSTDPKWDLGEDANAIHVMPYPRKSSAKAKNGSIIVMFGGVDGNRVLDDTWLSDAGDTSGSYVVNFVKQNPTTVPPARWGHAMTVCAEGTLMFGGFDENNEPLNDLWVFSHNTRDWYEITHFAVPGSLEVVPTYGLPRPRGGHIFGIVGMYKFMWGGTDGESYMSDAWVIDQEGAVPSSAERPWVWRLIHPHSEMSHGPSPRAFAAYSQAGSSMRVFGGRCGTMPTSKDSDSDWVSDYDEVSLGGAASGRDPTINYFYTNGLVTSTEKIPYAYRRFGGISPYWLGYKGAIADFESMSFPHADESQKIYNSYVAGTPYEGRRTPGPTPESQVEEAGYEAMLPQYTSLWWHPSDAAGQWELGAPVPTLSGGPDTAYRGRWCFGTGLTTTYSNNTTAYLYSPLFSLTTPSDESESYDTNNWNDYYLVFHEWLDLADEGDSVRIEAIRPVTGADINNRVLGTGKELVTVYSDRNNAYNSNGKWVRQIVPLSPLAEEENVYFRFVLKSDGGGRASGWYIDDVAVLRAGAISGTVTGGAGTKVYLYGADGVDGQPMAEYTVSVGNKFGFDLLAAGDYRVYSPDGSSPSTYVGALGGTWAVSDVTMNVDDIILGITVNSPALITWNSIPGEQYLVMYATAESLGTASPWETLYMHTATSGFSVFRDDGSLTPENAGSDGEQSRFYRVVLIK